MAPTIFPWNFLDLSEKAALEKSEKTFAQAVAASCKSQLKQLPSRTIIGDSVRIKISQYNYEAGIGDCSANLTPNHPSFKAQIEKSLALSEQLDRDSAWKRLF